MSGPGIRGHFGLYRGGAAERQEVQAAIVRFVLAGVVALVLVATPVAFWIRGVAEQHALESATVMTQGVADYAMAPVATEQLLNGDPAAVALLDQRLRPWLEGRGAIRVKVWDARSRIVYSDVPELIGRTFELDGEARALLAGGPATATLEKQDSPENGFEASSGELVEVYVRAMAQSGDQLIFEAYYDGTQVRREQASYLLGIVPPLLLAMSALQLAQLIPAVRLARRIQSYQAVRHSLLRRAIEASDLERRRIARELHDEVIQDLSGLAYALESEERQGPVAGRSLFTNARTLLQDNVRTLRAMTSELYPPDLGELGLKASLLRLAMPLQEHGISVRVDVPDEVDLDRERTAIFYRVAREALANVMKHSSAQSAELRLMNDGGRVQLLVTDDGRGFDPASPPPDGHLGMRILRDTIIEAGGTLEIHSGPGRGTTVTVSLGATAPAVR
ncbi:two-component sensor histidine kinase [Arthrobacter sp. SW1]|uniref:sensor histidine kinase n=1 Tax=Arthrobacter sp. SW1 TaxID=1920889 RepID=UPI000877B32B|nr:sensor histidine kinase [Arthrobacter sp. SW1]OFI37356.1 two-component sensor histidine kinase [Arthrobacter sp. SW1]